MIDTNRTLSFRWAPNPVISVLPFTAKRATSDGQLLQTDFTLLHYHRVGCTPGQAPAANALIVGVIGYLHTWVGQFKSPGHK
jgi:hypothetical protein